MKTPRLLPVVIAAATALLLLKSVSLVTGGGYVLTGATTAIAAGGGHGGGGAAEGNSGDPTIQLPPDATMVDVSPVLADQEPTLPVGGHGPADAHGATKHNAAAEQNAAHGAPEMAATQPCPVKPEDEAHVDKFEGFNFGTDQGCKPDPGVNAAGDALPLIQNGQGQIVPLAELDPAGDNAAAIVERLGERREALDQREQELEMRQALVEAAEKRIDERTSTLKALEDKINSLLAEKKAADQQQFVSIVAMYETMKPREAAAIFDKLDMPVLLQVARAMNPRKMAPILARMDPVVAKTLTAGLAADDPRAEDRLSPDDLASLPQIIGQ